MESRDLDLSIEPAAIRGLTPEQKERLADVLDGYLSVLEQGLPPSREELLKLHPDLAGPLRTYFDSLDELHDMAASFGRAATRADAEAAAPPAEARQLGDFRLGREIGRGGMGVVYEAEQISLARRVALKVLPFAAVLDGRQIARFKHEAQAAAQLHHPHIVSVIAVGVERGVHYYAMQFIDGQSLDRAIAGMRGRDEPQAGLSATEPPFTAACASTRRSLLTTRGASQGAYLRTAVALAIQAAEALHAAHEHGIVHRDVKPSNLLLDGEGKLWVTDFGLARRQADPGLTRSGDLVGTLRYMSPEQASGQSALVDHRTDIYSLGATLYELLTLEAAFPGDDGAALLRAIEKQEPRPLRQIQPKISADLETVVLKAMAKRREDRYATAAEFAEDLRRVLEGKPTIARPPTLFDRAGKWAVRHRQFAAAAAAVGLLALLGLGASTFLIAREKAKTERNYALAEKRFHEAQDAVECLGIRLSERLANVPDAAPIRRDLLRQTLEYYRELVAQAKGNPALRADLAVTYSKIAGLAAEVGSSDEAIDAGTQAIAVFRELTAENPGDFDSRRRLAVCENDLALALSRSGRTDEARRAYADAIRLQEELGGGSAGDPQCLTDLAVAQSNLGLLQSETADAAGAEASFAAAIRLQERLLAVQPDNPERLRNLATTLNNLTALHTEREPAQLIELYQKAASFLKRAAAIRPDDLDYRSDLALTYNNLGGVQSRIGAPAEAAESYAKSVEIQSELVRAAPARKSYAHTLAVGCNNLGLTQSKLGEAEAAEHSFRRALALQEPLAQQDPQNVEMESSLGSIYNNLGIAEEKAHRTADAVASYERAVEHQRRATLQSPQVSRYREFLSKHYYNYGRALRQAGQFEAAARAALARRDLWPGNPQHLFAVADELALAAKDLASPGGTGVAADEYAALAVETLKQAAAAGWKPTRNGSWIESFAAVRRRPEFVALLNK